MGLAVPWREVFPLADGRGLYADAVEEVSNGTFYDTFSRVFGPFTTKNPPNPRGNGTFYDYFSNITRYITQDITRDMYIVTRDVTHDNRMFHVEHFVFS